MAEVSARWHCAGCHANNMPERATCFRCGRPGPRALRAPGGPAGRPGRRRRKSSLALLLAAGLGAGVGAALLWSGPFPGGNALLVSSPDAEAISAPATLQAAPTLRPAAPPVTAPPVSRGSMPRMGLRAPTPQPGAPLTGSGGSSLPETPPAVVLVPPRPPQPAPPLTGSGTPQTHLPGPPAGRSVLGSVPDPPMPEAPPVVGSTPSPVPEGPPVTGDSPFVEKPSTRERPEIHIFNEAGDRAVLLLERGGRQFRMPIELDGAKRSLDPGTYHYTLLSRGYRLTGRPDQVGWLTCRKFRLYELSYFRTTTVETRMEDLGDAPPTPRQPR